MNEVFYSNDTYYLSYMWITPPFAKALDEWKGSPHVGATETAICIKDPWKCLILLGDHREQYTPISSDLEACKKYFLDNKSLIAFTSDDLD